MMSRCLFELKVNIDQNDRADQWTQMQLESWNIPDTDRFLFACHELVINSVDAMLTSIHHDKSIRLTIEHENQERKVSFTINDWGGGISEEMFLKEKFDGIDPFEERGRGLILIKMMTDSFIVQEEVDGSYSYTIRMCY